MKAKTSLLVLGLFTSAGAVTVSCGGSSDDGDNTAGSTSTSAGTSAGGVGGKGSTAGSPSSSGTANNTGGNVSNGGTNNNFGGAFDLPGFGGAGPDVPDCPAGAMNGATCTPGGAQACQANDTTYCGCQPGANPTWLCIDTGDLGGGGQGPGGFEADCPANPMSGDACTGIGFCTGGTGTCGCYQNNVICG